MTRFDKIIKMLDKFLDALLACRHKRTTWPIKLRGQERAHVTCIDCGEEIENTTLDAVAK